MPAQPAATPSAAERREIRLFVSSTFRDMQEEREELVKKVFPRLRRLCESRGITWGEVDLRWGVTDEARAEGQVLPLCLQEIEHCRPYFIGLLGERYGWVPEEFSPEMLETQSWLEKHRGSSVTALEILHGVLQDPEMAEHAYFYFRDPAYAAAHAGFTEEDPALREKLGQLKNDIRNSGFPVREPFATPKQLAEWVLRDLTAVVEKLYPEKEIPNPLDRAALDHEAYSASRRSIYIGRQEYMDRLDTHAASDGPPLVIAGESGSGKSALLANWTHAWSRQHPETPLLVHFIGAGIDSADWMAMLRRLLGEFQRRAGIQIEIPDKPDGLRATFANALHMVAARGRFVLVLDALNQIEDRDGAPDLVWLPPVIPNNMRLIVSTLPGRSSEDLKRRGWPTMTIEPITPPERERLIVDYLKRYAKQLDAPRRKRIAAAPPTGNALYLSTLLNELRLFGRHEDLDKRIDWYLQASDPLELYGKVIQRWEQDYEEPGSGSEDLVGESLTRLWAARRGLSEVELLELLGSEAGPLPRALWTPLYLAARDALVDLGGLLTFAHDYLRQAVRDAYLPTGSHEQRAHRTLAEYFNRQPHGPRQLDELPWQWQEAAEWRQLAGLLAAPAVFEALWNRDEFEVKAYWSRMETHSPLRMEQVYAPAIRNPKADSNFSWCIGTLLADTGKLEAALAIQIGLADYYRSRGDRPMLAGSLGNQAAILKIRGDLDGAMALLDQEERLCRDLGNQEGLQHALGNRALILETRGDLDGAMALMKEQERLCRDLGDKRWLSNSLGNQALILKARGNLDGAMALRRQQEHLCRELGDKEGLSNSLGNQAVIAKAHGDLDGAIALHKQEEHLCRELGSKEGLSNSLGNQALIAKARGDLDGALALMKQQERLGRELGNKEELQLTFGNQANILVMRGDLEGAMGLYREQERLCRELGNKHGLQRALGNQANVLDMRGGDRDGAMALYKEQERLCRELGTPDSLAISLANQAVILIPDRSIEARSLAEEALQIATRYGYVQLIPQIERIRDSISAGNRPSESEPGQPTMPRVERPIPSSAHPAVDAAQLAIEYGKALREWQALPFLKRMRTPKPTPPAGG